MTEDIRWQQRFANYKKALAQLNRFIEKGELNEFEEQGLIQSFEYTYELGWKTLQDFLRFKGYNDTKGPGPVIQQAFQDDYIDGLGWAKMKKSRELTSHTYNEEIADEIVQAIQNEYVALLNQLAMLLEGYDPQQLELNFE